MKLVFFLVLISFNLFAKSDSALFEDSTLINIAPPIINNNYFLLEYGFIVEKKSNDYKYNAYVDISLFQESKKNSENLKSGALGIKAGLFLPLSNHFPLSFQLGGGIAKSVLHPNPIFGKNDQSKDKDNLFLAEIAFLYKYNSYFSKLMYQKTNVDYFSKNLFLSFGVTY